MKNEERIHEIHQELRNTIPPGKLELYCAAVLIADKLDAICNQLNEISATNQEINEDIFNIAISLDKINNKIDIYNDDCKRDDKETKKISRTIPVHD